MSATLHRESGAIDTTGPVFATRLASTLRTCREDRGVPLRRMARASQGMFTASQLREIERGRHDLTGVDLSRLAALYEVDLSGILLERVPLAVDPDVGRIDTAGISRSFDTGDSDAMLVAYLKLVRELRDLRHQPTIELRRDDIDVLAATLHTDGQTVLDRLGELMHLTVAERRSLVLAFVTGATIFALAGGAVAVDDASFRADRLGDATNVPFTLSHTSGDDSEASVDDYEASVDDSAASVDDSAASVDDSAGSGEVLAAASAPVRRVTSTVSDDVSPVAADVGTTTPTPGRTDAPATRNPTTTPPASPVDAGTSEPTPTSPPSTSDSPGGDLPEIREPAPTPPAGGDARGPLPSPSGTDPDLGSGGVAGPDGTPVDDTGAPEAETGTDEGPAGGDAGAPSDPGQMSDETQGADSDDSQETDQTPDAGNGQGDDGPGIGHGVTGAEPGSDNAPGNPADDPADDGADDAAADPALDPIVADGEDGEDGADSGAPTGGHDTDPESGDVDGTPGRGRGSENGIGHGVTGTDPGKGNAPAQNQP